MVVFISKYALFYILRSVRLFILFIKLVSFVNVSRKYFPSYKSIVIINSKFVNLICNQLLSGEILSSLPFISFIGNLLF